MTKDQLVRTIAKNTGHTQASIDTILSALKEEIRSEVKEIGEAIIPGLCIFKVTDRAARKAQDPRTGATIEIPAKRVVKAKPYGAKTWDL